MPRNVLMIEALHDELVANAGSEGLARAMGVPLVSPHGRMHVTLGEVDGASAHDVPVAPENGFDDLDQGVPLVHQLVYQGMPLAPICQKCHEQDVCGGGYLPHRYARATGFNNPSVWCADILKLLAYIRHSVATDHAA